MSPVITIMEGRAFFNTKFGVIMLENAYDSTSRLLNWIMFFKTTIMLHQKLVNCLIIWIALMIVWLLAIELVILNRFSLLKRRVLDKNKLTWKYVDFMCCLSECVIFEERWREIRESICRWLLRQFFFNVVSFL